MCLQVENTIARKVLGLGWVRVREENIKQGSHTRTKVRDFLTEAGSKNNYYALVAYFLMLVLAGM
jgi:hypothetical protein